MSDALLAGAFICRNLKTFKEPVQTAFCRPNNIRIYSAPAPVRHRAVVYGIRFVFGEEQPDTVEAWANSKEFVSPHSGRMMFTFTTGTVDLSMEALYQQIRRHFLESVLKGKVDATHSERYIRIAKQNTSKLETTLVDNYKLRVYDVHHVVSISMNDQWEHATTKSVLRYHGLKYDPTQGDPIMPKTIAPYFEIPYTYADQRSLLSAALTDYINPEQQEKQELLLSTA